MAGRAGGLPRIFGCEWKGSGADPLLGRGGRHGLVSRHNVMWTLGSRGSRFIHRRDTPELNETTYTSTALLITESRCVRFPYHDINVLNRRGAPASSKHRNYTSTGPYVLPVPKPGYHRAVLQGRRCFSTNISCLVDSQGIRYSPSMNPPSPLQGAVYPDA